MALDTLIKKFFPVIIAAALAGVAYFQASGVVELLTADALTASAEELSGGSLRPKAGLSRRMAPRKSASAIINHNVFDFEVDLHPKKEEVPEGEEEEQELDIKDPLSVDACEGVVVHIVTESTDPKWSIAVLQGPGEEKGVLRRVEDVVAEEFDVKYIGFNWLKRSPAVWMSKKGELCQALLFADEKQKPGKKKTAKKEPPPPAKPTTKRRGAPKLDKAIADKIEKVSDTEFNLDRAVVDNILDNQAQLMRSARIVPEKGPDGKIQGIRLFGVRPDTLLGTLGLQNGDRLETINGFEMASPEKALAAYARLRTASKLEVNVTRRGKPLNLEFNIK